MGYDERVQNRMWLFARIQDLYKNGEMPYNEFKKFTSKGYLIENLYSLEEYIAKRYPLSGCKKSKTFEPGQPVIYKPKDANGIIYKKEYGIVKRMNDEGTCAFVWYHSGCTAASTRVEDLEPSDMKFQHLHCHTGCSECLQGDKL